MTGECWTGKDLEGDNCVPSYLVHDGPWKNMKYIRRMTSSGMLRRAALVRTNVSEELSASIIRVTRIGELWTTLAVKEFFRSVLRLLVTADVPSSPILATLMMEAPSPPKRRLLQEPHGVTSQKTAFFIVTAAKTSNLTKLGDRDIGFFSLHFTDLKPLKFTEVYRRV
jgi:hypothetical protein